METLDDSIDFDAYLRGPDENAKVKAASSWEQAVIDRIYSDDPGVRGRRLPWRKLDNMLRLRPGEVSLWPGMNGHGKSAMVCQVMIGLMEQGERVCIASMEMEPVATMERMSRQAGACEFPAVRFIRTFHAWTNGRLWLYDQRGTVKGERILSVMRYCHEQLGVTHFVIDSLMKCGIDEDDYNGQKRFIDELCAIARDTKMHIHLIAHSRKGKDEYEAPNKMDVKGSGSITDQVDNVLTVWRNKRKELMIAEGKDPGDQPDAILICDKQRHYSWEGRVGLWFDKKSIQYMENPHHQPTLLQLDDIGNVEMVEL